MIRLELSDDQAALLRETLESKLQALLVEIRHTKHREYRELLKHREQSLGAILTRLDDRVAHAVR